LVVVVKEEYLSKLESTETRDHSDHATTPKPKSAAASRILRAVEKSRSGDGPSKAEHPEGSAATAQAVVSEPAKVSPVEAAPPKAQEQPVQIRPVVEAQDALRSLSENQAPPTVVKQVSVVPEPAPAPVSVKAPVAEQKAKPAPAPAETPAPKVESKPKFESKPQVEPKPQVEAKPVTPEAPKSKNNKKNNKESEAPAPAAKSKPEVKPEPVEAPAASSVASYEAPALGMGSSSQSAGSGMPMALKAIILVAVLGGGGFGVYKFAGKSADEKTAQSSNAKPVFIPMTGVGGWSPNWGGDPAKTNGRAISLFRESAQHVNYRIEFEGQIENKAFGWVFRAKDPQNYYAYKVEVVKPGLQALVALARFSVVDGVESQKHYTLLEKPVRPGTSFSIRMDARGSEFKTWINDQLIETWQDKKINSGGVGLFNEKDERAQVRKVQIFEMR
jgi:hypothetical protein